MSSKTPVRLIELFCQFFSFWFLLFDFYIHYLPSLLVSCVPWPISKCKAFDLDCQHLGRNGALDSNCEVTGMRRPLVDCPNPFENLLRPWVVESLFSMCKNVTILNHDQWRNEEKSLENTEFTSKWRIRRGMWGKNYRIKACTSLVWEGIKIFEDSNG